MLELEKYIIPEMGAIWERQTRYDCWLKVEIAVLEAKDELGLIPPNPPRIIYRTKCNVRFTVEAVDAEDRRIDQEMVAFLNVVSKGLPAEVRPFWHAGLTSFDVWDTARALQMKKANLLISAALKDLVIILRESAQTYKYAQMIGRTHGIHAEPITFGLKLLNWVDELERQLEQLEKRELEWFVGKISGAVGNYANIDPRIEEMVCRKFGIGVARISNQIVSRDRHYAWLTALSSLNNSLEKIATNIRLLQQTEVSEVQEPFYEEGGSSAMPHKRNPNKSERICSLARIPRAFSIVAGEHQALQWGERSLDESAAERVIIPLTAMFTYYNLRLLAAVIADLKVDKQRMMENIALTKGAIFSQAVMLALADKGMDRGEARVLVQQIALKAWDSKVELGQALKSDQKVTAFLSPDEIDVCFDAQSYLRNIDQIFARFGM